MEQFGKFMGSLSMVALNTIIFGLTFSILWSWFIVPTFEVQELTIIQGIGLGSVKSYLFYKKTKSKKVTFKRIVKGFLNSVAVSAMSLGLGYIYTLFM